MICYLISTIMNYCCFGKASKQKRLVDEIKADMKLLTEEELHHLRIALMKPLKTYCC